MTNTTPPDDDAGYLDRLTHAIFSAGLNWRLVENKWSDFGGAFSGFSPGKVARLSEAEVRALMNNRGIIRNEKKIRSTIENARMITRIQREYGGVKEYIRSFGKDETRLQEDLRARFKHVGPSTARTFLWMVGYKLTPTKEERAWMKSHHEKA